MRPIIEISRDSAAGLRPMYLTYSRNAFARTDSRDPEGSVNVDVDANGDAIGIEILNPDDESISLAFDAAIAYGLSLAGVFKAVESTMIDDPSKREARLLRLQGEHFTRLRAELGVTIPDEIAAQVEAEWPKDDHV